FGCWGNAPELSKGGVERLCGYGSSERRPHLHTEASEERVCPLGGDALPVVEVLDEGVEPLTHLGIVRVAPGDQRGCVPQRPLGGPWAYGPEPGATGDVVEARHLSVCVVDAYPSVVVRHDAPHE